MIWCIIAGVAWLICSIFVGFTTSPWLWEELSSKYSFLIITKWIIGIIFGPITILVGFIWLYYVDSCENKDKGG